jgi:hypothetical protein
MIAFSNMKSEPMPSITGKNLVSKKRFLNSLLKCNIYRVAKFRGSWRFVRYESAGPSSLEHPRSETRPQPQSGAACAHGRGKSWAYGQSRECKVCGVSGPSRADSKSPQRRSRTALHSKITNVVAINPKLLGDSLNAPISAVD